MDVGSRKQLFIDNKFIEKQEGIILCMNPPVKAGTALVPETPWEKGGIACTSIISKDSESWMCYHSSFKVEKSLGQFMNVNANVEDKTATVMCLAVSKDGVAWQRKHAGRFIILGSKDNNIVLPESIGTVFVDPHKTDGFSYWFFGQMRENPWWDGAKGTTCTWSPMEGSLHLARSRDGLSWERVPGHALPFLCDTQNQVFFDTRLNKYVFYTRGWEFPNQAGDYGRVVCRGETDQLLKFPWPFQANPARKTGPRGLYGTVNTELPIVMRCDKEDPPVTDLYNPCVHQYSEAADVYVAFPSQYRHYDAKFNSHGRDKRGQADDKGNDGPLDIACAVSRDGVKWNRFRQPYVRLDQIGAVDGGALYMATGMIIKDHEIWQYYTAISATHGNISQNNSVIIRLVQRLDGFVSADAGPQGGELTTPVIKFRGNRLQLNIDCGAMGEAWVEILDKDGNSIKGYAMDDAVSVDRNGVAQEVWWKKGPDVSSLSGKPVRMRIKMRSSKLYSFMFTPAECSGND